jgi:amidophosphoribosyltransferase
MCGFFGIVSSREVVADCYDALLSLQHRGQDAAGILTYDEGYNQIRLEKGVGLVRDAFSPEALQRLHGHVGLAHTRYPTVGGGSRDDAQPFLCNAPFGIGVVHNGNLTNFHALREELFARSGRYIGSACDAEVLLNVLADELQDCRARVLEAEDVFAAVAGVFRRAQGAYSAAAMVAGQGLVAFRDPMGIRPIVMGTRHGPGGQPEFAFASESATLSLLGFGEIEDVQAGEAVWVDPGRRVYRRRLVEAVHHPCIFEWVYLARPDALLEGVSVYQARQRAGAHLARRWAEEGPPTDVIMPVPDSARSAAQEMAGILGIPYREGLVKNRYVGRTFIMPGRTDRRKSVRNKLNPIRLEFEGKRVLLVDDSIVRGNTSRELVRMARDAGASSVYLASCSPPLQHPCVYGIDMSRREEFIARSRSVAAIRDLIGADFLLYQDLPDLEATVRDGNPFLQQFCTACFTGQYPTGDVTPELFALWEVDRARACGGQPLLPFGSEAQSETPTLPTTS